MSGTKPTPGPWRVIGSSVYAGRTPVAECSLGIAGERGPSYDEQCANARAIGAVPDLIKALQASLDGHRATWMAARAEVEGAATAAALFEKEPEVIAARAALLLASLQPASASLLFKIIKTR